EAGEERDEPRPHPALVTDCGQQSLSLTTVHHYPRVDHALGCLGLVPHLRRRWEWIGVQAAASPVIEDIAEDGALAGDRVGSSARPVELAGERIEYVQHDVGVGQVRQRPGVL